jgi:hypothetical protein
MSGGRDVNGFEWCGVDDVNDRPVGNPNKRCDENSSKFFLSYEIKVINPVGESQT